MTRSRISGQYFTGLFDAPSSRKLLSPVIPGGGTIGTPPDLKQCFTCSYAPRTNGKAEYFIQAGLYETVYARSYDGSEQCAGYLMPWSHRDNGHRPHASLNHKPSISRIHIPQKNVVASYIML